MFPLSKGKAIIHYLFFIILFNIILSEDAEINYVTSNDNIYDLNSFYIITKIQFGINHENPNYYLFGIFEGSNDTSFSDSLPLTMIKENDLSNADSNTITINTPNSYRYVKYIPYNINGSNISPLTIYGHLFDATEDLSSKVNYHPTNLPLMIINTENSIEPDSKEVYINSRIIIINSDGEKKLNASAGVRLRGHGTSRGAKKPYKIKFDSKAEIPGIDDKYKKWALLANYYDRSLIRNHLAFEVSRRIGFKYTPRCIFLDVIFNRNFRGNYYICDQVEVKKGRVEVTEMDKTDNEYPEITGGYLLEFDQRVIGDQKLFFLTDKGLIGEIKYPDEDDITKEQINYIRQYMNNFEKYAYKGDFKYFDLDSFYNYFIMQEFCGDVDSVISSFHIYKERNDDKLHFGPVWDYDLAFDNDGRLFPTKDKDIFCYNFGSSAGSLRNFITKIINTKNIMKNINSTWIKLQEDKMKLNELKKYVEDETEILMESANLNNLRWYESKVGNGINDYKNSVKIINNYLENRFDNLTYLINNYNYDAKIRNINFGILFICLLFLV